MNREVNVAEFKQYFATLSEVEKNKLGHNWQQDRNGTPAADNTPVGAIPWEAAQGYANWLAQQTQCKLSLPTYNQWVAASVQHADPNKVVTRQHQQASRLMPTLRPQEPEKVFDLLGNLREWVNDKTTLCPNDGHFAVGEDYKTWLQNLSGEPYCETMAIDTVGFRLVRMK
jgi:formylglycine-generating enzyme required for sulfatase activity